MLWEGICPHQLLAPAALGRGFWRALGSGLSVSTPCHNPEVGLQQVLLWGWL